MGEHPSAQNGGYVPVRHWANRYEVCASNIISSCHVETVCLLSNTQRPKKESYITLDVETEDYYRIKNEGKNSTT